MAGSVPPKKPDQRRRRNVPERGEWKAAPGIGWQHGRKPPPPAELGPLAKKAWTVWMGAWFAAHWTPDDLPGLRVMAYHYSLVMDLGYASKHAAELRLEMESYGITPKGWQDRRWMPPVEEPKAAPGGKDYTDLRLVAE